MYKMVSLPSGGGSSKDAGIKATQVSYRAFTTGLNRIGATINSTIVVNKQIKDALIQNLKLKDKEFEEEKKRFQREKEEKNKMKKGGSGFPSLGVGKAAEKVAGGFFAGLAQLGGALLKFVVTQSILRWIGNPANIQKLIKIVQAIINVVTFFSRFLRDNIVRMFDGLATMLDSKKNIFEKLGGFVTFFTGFGAILAGALILKRPRLVIKGITWVLSTLFKNLTKSKVRLTKQLAQGALPSRGGGSYGSWSRQQGGGNNVKRPGGKRNWVGAALDVATVAVPLVVGGMMAGGPSEFDAEPGSMSAGDNQQPAAQPPATQPPASKPKGGFGLPFLADGGVATRPTAAMLGEAGPEMRMPLDNATRMANAGIKPLSSLGGMMGGGAKQAKKLSDLFMAPFRGIGAGILANISGIVGGTPMGRMITPILGNIIAPIANSFGVPPSLVKKLTGKMGKSSLKGKKGKAGGALGMLFGKGVSVKNDSKKYKKVGDTSVLGLLSNILSAVQVIGNKAGRGSSSTTSTTPSDAGGAPDMHVGDSIARGLSGETGDGTATDSTQVGRSSKGVLEWLKSQDADKFKGKTIRLSSGILNSPSDLQSVEEQLKLLKAAGAKVQLVGVPTNNSQFSSLNPKLKALADKYGALFLGGYEATASDKVHISDYAAQTAKYNEVAGPSTSSDPDTTKPGTKPETPGEGPKQLTAQEIGQNFGKKTHEVIPFMHNGENYHAYKTAKGWDIYKGLGGLYGKMPIKTDRRPNGTVENYDVVKSFLKHAQEEYGQTQNRAEGGWISGPMSGYPVSLDGGGSTAFIGHGTEWVGFKKAAGGGAFVIPFDTPATKNNPGLTGSRMRQAKQGGFALPEYAGGGVWMKSRETPASAKKKYAAGGEVIPNVQNESHWSAGVPLVTVRSKKGKTAKVAKALSKRFQGFINALEAFGYPINEMGGFRGDEKKNYDGKGHMFAHTWGAAIDINASKNPAFVGTKAGDIPPESLGIAEKFGLGNLWYSKGVDDVMHFTAMKREGGAGINGKEIWDAKADLGADPGSIDTASGGDDGGSETQKDPFVALQEAMNKLNQVLGYAPPEESVEKKTGDAAKAKDEAVKATKKASGEATAQALKAATQTTKTAAAPTNVPKPPVLLPGPRTSVPIQVAWSPTTSLYQPTMRFA